MKTDYLNIKATSNGTPSSIVIDIIITIAMINGIFAVTVLSFWSPSALALTSGSSSSSALPSAKYPSEIKELFQRLEKENLDLKLQSMNLSIKNADLKAALSKRWPNIAASSTSNWGQTPQAGLGNLDPSTNAPSDSIGSGGPSTPPPTPSTPESQESFDGRWAAQASMGYFLYTKRAVTEQIQRARYAVQSSQIEWDMKKNNKRAQLLQLLLEWQALRQVGRPLEKAQKTMSKVKSHSAKGPEFLYSTRDRIDLEEKMAFLKLQTVRIREAKALIFNGLKELIPSLTAEKLAQLPVFEITYPLPDREQISKRFRSQSQQVQILNNDIATYEGYQKVAQLDRPWIPMVYLSTSYSYSGDYDGFTRDGGLGASVVLNFNVFDGFLAQARRQQASVAVGAARTRKKMEISRRSLYLQQQRMQAIVKGQEYAHKKLLAAQKHNRLKDIQRKVKQGIGTRLEMSLASLDLVNSRFKAYEAKKKAQQAMLSVAVGLSEWSQVAVTKSEGVNQ